MTSLTLTNTLSDISFCDKKCSNVNNNDFKEEFIRLIDDKYKISVVDKPYVFLNPSILKNVLYHQHLLTLLTNGNPYLLYLTRIDNINCCFYIDRKLKSGFSFPKIHFVKYQFHDDLFNDTIFSGELVRDKNKAWFFLIDNLLVLKGEKMNNENIVSKFDTIYSIFNNNYVCNQELEPCPIQIKKLFSYSQIKTLINKYLPSLSYYCRGIVFYNLNTKYSNYSLLFPKNYGYKLISDNEIDDMIRTKKPTLWSKTINQSNQSNQGDSHSHINSNSYNNNMSGNTINSLQNTNTIEQPSHNSNETDTSQITKITSNKLDKNNIVFKVLHTDMPDVFNLYIYNEDKTDLIKYDNALVPNMVTSKYLYKLFQNNKNTINISMECKYSHIFKKWIPIKQVENEPYKLQDIEQLVN